MDQTALPQAVRQAVTVKTAGATGVARLAIEGLLEVVHDPAALARATAFLADRLTGYAPIWHIGNAVRAANPAAELCRLRAELDSAVEFTVKAAVTWVAEHGGPVTVAPSSSIVGQVLDQLGPEIRVLTGGGAATDPAAAAGTAATGGAATGGAAAAAVARLALAGADAIGPETVLNIVGTRELAARVPTLVVTTALKLVPGPVFERLGAPVFEPIPLESFLGVILDGEFLTPAAVGARAAALRE